MIISLCVMYETDSLLGLQYRIFHVRLRVRRLMRRWDCRAMARGIHPGCRMSSPRLGDGVLTSGEQVWLENWEVLASEPPFLTRQHGVGRLRARG
jgi:hypothetical protein